MSRWISSAINGIASLWGVHQQNKNIDKQLSAQAAENRKMREYNLMLAKQQNQWNLEQWNRENAYNSPSAQMERMRQAGLNPDMMYGGGVGGNLAASSPSMTSGSAAPPMDWSSLANKATVADALDSQLKQAQIDNINADTKKKGEEASILSSDASFRDAYNHGLLNTQNAEIRVSDSKVKLTDQQIKESQENIRQIDANINHINEVISKLRIDSLNSIRITDAQIKQIAADVGLKDVQAKSLSDQLQKILDNLDADHQLKLDEHNFMEFKNKQAKFHGYMHGAFDLEENKEFRFIDRALKGVVRFVDLFSNKSFQLD